MKKLSMICAFALVFGLMAAPAFALSFKLDFYGGDTSYTQGTFEDPAEIDLYQSETVMVDIWLVGWAGENVASVDYYFWWDTLSIDVVSISYDHLIKPTGQWDDEYHVDLGGGQYALGTVEYGLGVAGPDVLLHTVILHCTYAPSDDLIKATLGVDGAVGDTAGDGYTNVTDADGTINQLECVGGADCDDGLFCNGTETCEGGACQQGTDPCPGQTCNEDTNSCKSTPATTTTTTPTGTTTTSTFTTSSTSTTIKPPPITTSSTSSSSTTTISILWPMAYDEMWGVKKDENLSLLRAFRDGVLADNEMGRDYIFMLYNNSLEILILLIQNPSLTKETKGVIDELLPGIESLLDGGEMVLPKKKLADLESLLSKFETKANPGLKEIIKEVKRDLRKGEVFEQWGITISE